MLSFKEQFPRKGTRCSKGTRVRIIGEADGKKLLFSVNNSKQTSIELVSPDGESITALSFNEYLDVINADLSSDNEFLHITKRITSNKGFAFSSIIYHIHSSARSREYVSNSPIYAFFLPDTKAQNFSLIHVVGNKMSHLNCVLGKGSIQIEVNRGGINIPNIISYTFHRSTQFLIVLHEVKNQNVLSEFNLKNFKSGNTSPIPIFVHPNSKLPPELSLSPLSPLHLPFFRCKMNRIFSTRYGSKICVIQQLFESVDGCLTFNICMYPRQFNTIVTVPTATADLPLCIQQFHSLIFAFVVNNFICLIDISQNPPFISLQMQPFCSGACSDCASPLPLSHHVVDLNSGDVFEVSVSLKMSSLFAKSMDKQRWDMMAVIASRTQSPEIISSLLNLANLMNDPFIFIQFAKKLFSLLSFEAKNSNRIPLKRTRSMFSGSKNTILTREASRSEGFRISQNISEPVIARLKEIESEFPSASSITRRKIFRRLVKQIMTNKGIRRLDDAAQQALFKLELQDNYCLVIRKGIDLWLEQCKPDQFWQFIIEFAILNESIFTNFPAIFVLKDEAEAVFQEIGSVPMYCSFRSHHIIGMTPKSPKKIKEIRHWREKIPIFNGTESDNSASLSSRSSKSSTFVVQRESSNDASDISGMSNIFSQEHSDVTSQ